VLARSAGPEPMAWCPVAARLAPSAAPGCLHWVQAAGTGAVPGTALTPTNWQTGQAATTMPRLVTVAVAHAAAAHVEHAPPVHPLIPLIPLIQQLLLHKHVQYMLANFVTIHS